MFGGGRCERWNNRDGDLTNPDDVAAKLHQLIVAHSFEQSGHRFDVREL